MKFSDIKNNIQITNPEKNIWLVRVVERIRYFEDFLKYCKSHGAKYSKEKEGLVFKYNPTVVLSKFERKEKKAGRPIGTTKKKVGRPKKSNNPKVEPKEKEPISKPGENDFIDISEIPEYWKNDFFIELNSKNIYFLKKGTKLIDFKTWADVEIAESIKDRWVKRAVKEETEDKLDVEEMTEEVNEMFEGATTAETEEITEIKDELKGKPGEYKYHLISRPFDIGTYYKENFIRHEDDGTTFGIVVYSQSVPIKEMSHYSFAPITELEKYDNTQIKYYENLKANITITKSDRGINFVRAEMLDEKGEVIDEETLSGIDFLRNIKKGRYKVIGEKIKEKQPEKELKGKTTDINLNAGNYKDPEKLNKNIELLLDKYPDRKPEEWSTEEKKFIWFFSGYGGIKGASGKGILYEYYTPEQIIKKMWGLAYKYGFDDGSVIETSCGVGRFFKFAPKNSEIVGYETNPYSARIAKILYPRLRINVIDGEQLDKAYFEQVFIKNNYTIRNKIENLEKFDLNIGNPPYGVMGGKYAGMGEQSYTKAKNYIEYFLIRGLDILKPGGLLIYIIGVEVSGGGKPFLQQGMTKAKEMIQERAGLIDAYRLPNGLFERTDVLPDIVVFRKK